MDARHCRFAPIGTLADLGLSGSLISDARRQFRLRDYLGLRILTCGLTLAVIAAAVLWAITTRPADD